MGKSRSQVSQLLVTLLNASGKLGSAAIESPLAAENFLNSGFTLPIAVVSTLEAVKDSDVTGRWDVARFRVSVVGSSTANSANKSSNMASAGSGSSEHGVENLVRDLLAALNASPGYLFTGSGFQGEVEEVSTERLCPHQDKTFVVVDVMIAVYDCTRADV